MTKGELEVIKSYVSIITDMNDINRPNSSKIVKNIRVRKIGGKK